MKSPSDNKAGFTLFELLVVLFIISIASAVLSVSLYRAEKKAGIKKTVRGIYSTMKRARDTALMERRPVTFNLDEETGTYWLDSGGRSSGGKKRIPQGMSIKGEPIVFFPKGNSTGGYVIIERGDYSEFSVEVDEVTGLARIKGL